MKKIIYIILLTLSFISCDNYLDIEPVGQVIPKSVEEYRSFLTSAYAITKNDKILVTYRGDELSLASNATGIEQYQDIYIWNDVNTSPLSAAFPYASFYNTIFYTNHIINNKEEISGDETAIEQLLGEAYALRALQYFNLVNLYAKPYNASTASSDLAVPITTEYDSEKSYPRATVEEVYSLIIDDLNNATSLININEQPLGYNYRFSLAAIYAFKARVYLYQQAWQKAIDASEDALAINNQLQDLNSESSLMPSEYNSVESILALETVASFDIATNATVSNALLGAYNQTEDLRFDLYFNQKTDGNYQSKKNAETKFKVSFRTAELYLILSEAYAQLDQLTLAKETLIDFTENRYSNNEWNNYKSTINAFNKTELLTEIQQERTREFAFEGHRWFDLRRTHQPEITKTFDGVSYTLKQNDDRYVIPFPNDAIINNPNL